MLRRVYLVLFSFGFSFLRVVLRVSQWVSFSGCSAVFVLVFASGSVFAQGFGGEVVLRVWV